MIEQTVSERQITKKPRGESEKLEIIRAAFANPGGIKEYCQKHHIRPQDLYFWRKRILQRHPEIDLALPTKSSEHSILAPVKVVRSLNQSVDLKIEIRFAKGHTVMVPLESADVVAKILRMIDEP